MFADLSDLRESLFAARILREQVLAAPVRPDGALRLRERFLRENGGRSRAIAASDASAPGFATITRTHLDCWAAAAGTTGPRSGPGTSFQGRAAPPPGAVEGLVEEMLETVNGPLALESWPPIARASALHFLLRLVQPWDGPVAAASAAAAAAEAAVLATDGFLPDRMLLAEPDVGADASPRRPDPDAFLRARVHRLVERLGDTAEIVREETARGVLLGWVEERGARLNARQERLLLYLADGRAPRSLSFQDYVRLHAGRRAPSLRSMQRDWQGLRDGGWLRDAPDAADDPGALVPPDGRTHVGRCVLDPDALAFGREPPTGAPDAPGAPSDVSSPGSDPA